MKHGSKIHFSYSERQNRANERPLVVSAEFGEHGLQHTGQFAHHALSHARTGALNEVIYLGVVLVLQWRQTQVK